MARARNIKPALFVNELLGTADIHCTVLFISLWCLADCEGKLEDRPMRIKIETFPYRDDVTQPLFNGYLTELERLGFIQRYSVNGVNVIRVVNFQKHQSPHHTEKPKGLPDPLPQTVQNQTDIDLTVRQPLSNGEQLVTTRSDSLIPDLLKPDSLIPDSLSPLPASAESEKSTATVGLINQEASVELTKHLDFVRSKFNLVQIKNEREWMEAVFRCEREKIDFEKFFEFIESKRDPTKSGSVTPKMMLSDNWIASFKNPTPKKEQENGNTRQPVEPVRYKSAAERNSEQVVRNFKALAAERKRIAEDYGSGNQAQLSSSNEGTNFEIFGTIESGDPF